MVSCPHCEYPVSDFSVQCPSCDGDLRALARLQELPDVQFNQALRAARAGNWPVAVMLLNAVLSTRGADVDAWVLLGTLYARRGAYSLAGDCWNTALLFRPGELRASAGLKAIETVLGHRRVATNGS